MNLDNYSMNKEGRANLGGAGLTIIPVSLKIIQVVPKVSPGRSAAWLARLNGVQKVGSSNLPAPTIASAEIPATS